MDLTLPLGTLLLAATLASALVPPSRKLARWAGALDAPGHRKIHANPTPRMGGIAVFAAFAGVAIGGYLLVPALQRLDGLGESLGPAVAALAEAHRIEGRLVALLLGAAVVFGVGALDDVVGVRFPARLKALGQLFAALILVIGGGVTTSFLPYAWMNVALSLLWVVGITNAFNLLDNMDGLSAGVALVASVILLGSASLRGEYFIALVLAAFIGSLAGFLFFNFKPASVFLGDCGSHFVGYMMASLTLLERYVCDASSTLFPVLMPLVVLAVPIADTASVVALRLYERRPIHVGDSRHLSHQLVALGFSQRGAVLLLYLVTASLGLGAFSLPDATPVQGLALLVQVTVLVSLTIALVLGPTARAACARPSPPRQEREPASPQPFVARSPGVYAPLSLT